MDKTGPDEARRRIRAAGQTGAEVLDIGGLGLTELPEELYKLSQLKVLYLGAAKDVRKKLKHTLNNEDKSNCNYLRRLPAKFFTALVNLDSLHLDHNSFTYFPAEIAELRLLTSLDLAGNRIGADGARAISTLPGLTTLDLSSNPIGADGARAIAELTQLTQLTSLNLTKTQIGDEGVRAIAAFTGLTKLYLGGNRIGVDGARAIAKLAQLSSLDLVDNLVGNEGACAIATLAKLTRLNLGVPVHLVKEYEFYKSECSIGDEGACAIANISGLTFLSLWGHGIGNSGARAIANLGGLTSLGLAHCRIGTDGARALLNAWDVREAGRLKKLDLRNNDFGDLGIPAETMDSCDAQAILAAYRAFRQGVLKPLNQAKMLVIGEEAVGKTSLIRYLIHDRPRDPDERKTPGTKIHEKIEIEKWPPEIGDIKLNVWDFGGQEIMHGTHRYFLTRRSLYLLVLEDRKEDDRSIYNWLKTIRNRGGDVPVIVVINKSDEGKDALRLDEEGLRREHPEIAAILRTSCNADDFSRQSIVALRKVIADCLAEHEGLREIRDKIPESWLWVKERVAKRARDAHVLGIAEFERLCLEAAGQFKGAEGLHEEATQRALLRLLHDLGVLIAHGLSADDLSVSPTVVLLDPNWLTRAIYAVLNHHELVQQKGMFYRKQLHEWLNPDLYPSARHKFILEMMQDDEMALAFELPGSKGERYLIPEGLPRNSPDYSMWPKDSLRFRFRYQFLPRGLIPRLIVAAHQNLTETNTPWRSGAVFQHRGCLVLVEGNIEKKVIDIAVADGGDNRRAALHVLLNYFDQVHRLNLEAGPEAFVPMPDNPAIEESYTHLLSLEKRKGPDYEFYPRGSERPYSVGDLLDGIVCESIQQRGGQSMNIKGGSGPINVSYVGGDISGDVHSVGRQQISRAEASSEPPNAPTTKQSAWGWLLISIGIGIAAVLAMVGIALLPSEWRLTASVLLGVFVAVTMLVFFRNPAWFYRRWIAAAVTVGLLWGAGGSVIDLKFRDSLIFSYKSEVDLGFYLVLALAIGLFVWADVQSNFARTR